MIAFPSPVTQFKPQSRLSKIIIFQKKLSDSLLFPIFQNLQNPPNSKKFPTPPPPQKNLHAPRTSEFSRKMREMLGKSRRIARCATRPARESRREKPDRARNRRDHVTVTLATKMRLTRLFSPSPHVTGGEKKPICKRLRVSAV